MEENIRVYDGLVSADTKRRVFDIAKKSYFTLGWNDKEVSTGYVEEYVHSKWNKEALDNTKLLANSALSEILDRIGLYEDRILQCVINLDTCADTHFTHTHGDSTVLLYYVNLNWEDGWAGETLFFNPLEESEVLMCSKYIPGRVVLFNGSLPHTIRPPSRLYPNKYRFTLSIVFDTPWDTLTLNEKYEQTTKENNGNKF
jgi:hypothetical protein